MNRVFSSFLIFAAACGPSAELLEAEPQNTGGSFAAGPAAVSEAAPEAPDFAASAPLGAWETNFNSRAVWTRESYAERHHGTGERLAFEIVDWEASAFIGAAEDDGRLMRVHWRADVAGFPAVCFAPLASELEPDPSDTHGGCEGWSWTLLAARAE